MDEEIKARFDDLDKRVVNAEKRFEDLTKARFDDLDKRLGGAEKRFDDIKWFVGGIAGLFTVVAGLNAVLGGLTFSNEKQDLRVALAEIKADAKTALGQVSGTPVVELLSTERQPLAGQEVLAQIDGDRLSLTIFVRNTGTATSGKMAIKIYTVSPLILTSRSSDEPTYEYEFGHTSDTMKPSEIPAGYAFESTLWMRMRISTAPQPGKYKALAKLYYGTGKVARMPFTLVVK